jgi:hypothetical protein
MIAFFSKLILKLCSIKGTDEEITWNQIEHEARPISEETNERKEEEDVGIVSDH